jgi:Family of unknown function (DUF6314)
VSPDDALMTSVKEAGEPTALLGEWQLTRSLRDELAGLSGTASGRLTLRAEDDGIAWQEQGTLLWNGSQLPFSRSYRLRRTPTGWWLYFADGRPFHPWTPGHRVIHPCAEDEYHGLITVDGPDSWQTLWDVRGPATAQRIRTQFTRLTGHRGSANESGSNPVRLAETIS